MKIYLKTIIQSQYLLVSLLMAFTGILAVLQVVLSTYGHRCRHPALRFFQWGASAVFIPLTAYVKSHYISKIDTDTCKFNDYNLFFRPDELGAHCMPRFFTNLLILWIVLVQIIKINTDMNFISVSTDGRHVVGDAGSSARTSVEIFAYSIWTTGLLLYYNIYTRLMFMLPLCALYNTKVLIKLVAFHRARCSFALGRNVEVISGYMAHVYEKEDYDGNPPYIAMGEEKRHFEKTPRGYRIKVSAPDASTTATTSKLITVDRIWYLWLLGDSLLVSQSRLKELCLSFSLFKSLRRRFAGYPMVEAGSRRALDFVLNGMLGADDDHDRVFQILINELAFASDFYYSCLPWHYVGGALATLNLFISLLVVAGVAFWALVFLITILVHDSIDYYMIATFLLTVAAMFIELWEMISGMCSYWTKLALLRYHIKRNGHHKCCLIQKALALVLRFKAVKRYNDRSGQNTMLEPLRFYKPPILFPKKLFHRASLHKSVNVPKQVKAAILTSLRTSGGRLSNGVAAIQRSTLRDTVIWSCQGDHVVIANVILVWHIGTSLFEMKYLHATSSPRTADMITATHLSQYCAYLVAAVPELLPDDATWMKAHYKEVAKDIMKALEGQGNSYHRLVDALGESTRHKVLQEGSKLTKQLSGEAEKQEEEEGTRGKGEAAVWKLLAEFWSEMVLYLAPSDNVEGHVEALARGGEFITLLWALLLHAGITSRPGNAGASRENMRPSSKH